MKNLLILAFLAFTHLGFAQLIDPFGKIITHEIKLNKQTDGTYIGAMEWTTDINGSLQRFVINNLDVKAPVMVRIISKAPDHNIDLSFYKTNWNKVESKISTNGDKFVDKIFRTMGIAGISVSSKVAGIPYLIIVRVGLQFPLTESLISITDNKEEYSRHMRKLGLKSNLLSAAENQSNKTEFKATNDKNNDSSLLYIIVGLLVIIIVILVVFLLRKHINKKSILPLIALFISAYTLAQTNEPKLVPIEGQSEPAVFYEYRTRNVGNQNTVPIDEVMNTQVVEMEVGIGDGTIRDTRLVRIDTSPGVIELSDEEAEEVNQRMREANEEFDRNFNDNMPGEQTEGDQRILPANQTREELEELRSQVRQLQRQVDLLSEEDEEYEEDVVRKQDSKILVFCEELEDCTTCVTTAFNKFNTHLALYRYLQTFYTTKINQLNSWIAYGDALASVPGAGLGWGPIRTHTVLPAMTELRNAYLRKFDEFIASMEQDLVNVRACLPSNEFGLDAFQLQMELILEELKAARINQ